MGFFKVVMLWFLIVGLLILSSCEDNAKLIVVEEKDSIPDIIDTIPDSLYSKIDFKETDVHEEYLTAFDSAGIKVYLQVESGYANMNTLIDLVINQYGHHKSVIGFGIDVEWYMSLNDKDINDGYTHNHPITDSLAEAWLKKIKSHNTDYTMFLKHWDKYMMPPNYRGNGDIIFLDDSQNLKSFSSMRDEFEEWADYFNPNPAHFQVGYTADKSWWQSMTNPMQEIGIGLNGIVNDGQEVGIFWVDFEFHAIADSTHELVFDPPADDVAYAGFRSSSYGFDEFPTADEWVAAFKKANGYFENSTPCGVWIVGELGEDDGYCKLFFPKP